MKVKRTFSVWLQKFIPLRWAFSVAVRVVAPRNIVGVMGAIFNDSGQVLLVEHVFRPQQPWGLPGGWVERGEDPAYCLKRELVEELNMKIVTKKLLFCEPQGGEALSSTPASLVVVFYCRVLDTFASPELTKKPHSAYEILSYDWIDPEKIKSDLSLQQQKAIRLGRQEFDKESSKDNVSATPEI